MRFIAYVNNPEYFVQRDYFLSVQIAPADQEFFYQDKPILGEVEIDVDIDITDIRRQAAQKIDDEIQKARAAVEVLENRKKNLLALEAPK